MFNNSNRIVSYVGNIARSCATSPSGRNAAFLRYKFGVDFHSKLSCNIARVIDAHDLSLRQQGLINNICNLLSVRECTNTIDGFDTGMIQCLIDSIACD